MQNIESFFQIFDAFFLVITESKRKQIRVKTSGKGIQDSSGKETDKDMTKGKELKEPNHAGKI